MSERWIIQVQGKKYGPADFATLREWKADGRVLSTNPARREDVALWKTAAEIPGLFELEPPPVQKETRRQRSEVRTQQPAAYVRGSGEPKEISDQKSPGKQPARNIFIETFRIYFRGLFQFVGLTLLSIVPILCAEFTGRFIDSAQGVNLDLRTAVAGMFAVCMLVLRIVLIPIYIAGIQILAAELATGQRIGFFSVLNGAVNYWGRVAGLGLFVYGVFFLLMVFALGIAIMILTSSGLVSIVLALGLLAFQVWLFGRFFINVLFWQQFAVLENSNAFEALRDSKNLARSGRDLPWYQRPLWRGALIVSIWFAFIIALSVVVFWPKLTREWPMFQDYFNQLTQTQDPQALLQKINANLQTRGFDYPALVLNIVERVLQPLLGIAFVVLYLDCKGDEGRKF